MYERILLSYKIITNISCCSIMDEFGTGTMANEMHMLILMRSMKFNGICKNRTLLLGSLVSCISVLYKHPGTCDIVSA